MGILITPVDDFRPSQKSCWNNLGLQFVRQLIQGENKFELPVKVKDIRKS